MVSERQRRYTHGTPKKGAVGNDKMILRVRLIGADLPPCGQIPVTE